MLLEGMFLPVTTPFYPDERVYLKKVEHNVGRYSLTPAAGLVVAGPGAEPSLLTDQETAELLQTAAAAAAKEKVLIAGIGRDSVHATLALAEIAWGARYDAVLVCAPSTPLTVPETQTYFRTVADRSPLPVILWSQPEQELASELILELAAHPQVFGLLDASPDPYRLRSILEATAPVTREVTVTTVFAAVTGRMLETETATAGSFVSAETLGTGGGLATAPPKPALRTRQKRVGFQVLTASTAAMLSAWEHGATGAVPSLAAAAPQACYEVWQAWKDADLPLAAEKQERLRAASHRMQTIAGIKYGCDLNGYFGGRPRLTGLALTAAEKLAIDDVMEGLRN